MLFLLDPVPPLNDPESFNRAFTNSENSMPNSQKGQPRIFQQLPIIRSLETKEKLGFLMTRINGARKRANHRIKKLFYWFYQFIGYPMPPDLQRFHNTRIYKKAKRNYLPGIYSNPTSILLTNKHSKDLPVWEKLIGKDVEVYKIRCDHRELLHGPHDRIWAEHLKTNLAKVHAAKSVRFKERSA